LKNTFFSASSGARGSREACPGEQEIDDDRAC